MDEPLVSQDVYKALDGLTDLWVQIAEEHHLKFPITFIVIGIHGQYLCGVLRAAPNGGYRLNAVYQIASLFAEPPHHTLLIDSRGRATRVTRAAGAGGEQGPLMVQ